MTLCDLPRLQTFLNMNLLYCLWGAYRSTGNHWIVVTRNSIVNYRVQPLSAITIVSFMFSIHVLFNYDIRYNWWPTWIVVPVDLLRFFCLMLVWQPMTVYSGANRWCHLTTFLLMVFHEVNHLQPFLASLSSLVIHLLSCRCVRIDLTSLHSIMQNYYCAVFSFY